MRRWLRFWKKVKKTLPQRSRGYRPWTEGLEDRRLLAAPVVDPISNQTVPFGKALYLPVTGSDADGDSLTYTVTSSNPQVTATVRPRGTALRISVAPFGDMVFQLFNDLAPRTIDVVSGFVKSKFYDGLTFHRVVKDFVIQGGDPDGDGTGGPGFRFDDEFNASSIFSGTGQLAMANSGKDTNGSQFFVTINPQRGLDHNHTILGQLVRGFDVLSRIADVPVGQNSRPVTPVTITRASLFTNNTDAVLSIGAGSNAGPAMITVTANDGRGGTNSQTFQVTPQTDGTNDPAILGAIANQITPLNTPLTFNLSGIDPENDPLEFQAVISGPAQQANVSVTGNQVTVTPNAGFTGAIRLRVSVKQQGATSRGSTQDPFDTQEITVTVGEQAITPVGVAGTGTEGTSVSGVNVATFTYGNPSAPASDFTARINWGDAQQSDGVVSKDGTTFRVAGTNTFKYAGRYPVRITVTSKLGHAVFTDATFTLSDAALTARAGDTVRGRQGTALNNLTVATFTDANPNARAGDFSATIDWGDSQTSVGTITAAVTGGFTIQGSHTYNVTGERTVRVSLSQLANTDEVPFNSATVNTPAAIGETPSNQRIVSQIYLDVLERPVDTPGMTTWTSRLGSGATRDQILVDIQNTDEGRRLKINKLYRKLLNRDVDTAGLGVFTFALSLGSTLNQVEAGIAASDEYFQQRSNSNVDTFLGNVFQNSLGRAIDAAALAGFRQQLANGGVTRRQVVDQIFATSEYRQALVRGFFQQLLRRITDPSGLNYFAGTALGSGARQEQVIAGICGSDNALCARSLSRYNASADHFRPHGGCTHAVAAKDRRRHRTHQAIALGSLADAAAGTTQEGETQEAQTLQPAQAARHVTGRVAGGATPRVRPAAVVPAQEPGRGAGLLRVRGYEPAVAADLSGPHSRHAARRQPLLLPRFHDQHPGHLQAHRVHACPTRTQARRPRLVEGRLSARVQRGLPAIWGAPRGPLPPRRRVPARAGAVGRPVLQRGWHAYSRGA